MSNNNSLSLLKYEENNSQTSNDRPSGDAQTLEQFNAMLNAPPEAHEIAINKAANNSKFVPISFVQMKLDKFFMGLWRTRDFRYSVVVNEICGSITLEYYHPFAKCWITREGSAAVMIMQKSGSDISDVNAKIKNTLQKDLPHLMASCIVSAAKTIGKTFGRDLNRKDEDDYETFYTDIAQAEAATECIEWDKVKTIDDLKRIWNANPTLHSNKNFVKTFTYRKGQLSKNKAA
jgi:hypothetical protein